MGLCRSFNRNDSGPFEADHRAAVGFPSGVIISLRRPRFLKRRGHWRYHSVEIHRAPRHYIGQTLDKGMRSRFNYFILLALPREAPLSRLIRHLEKGLGKNRRIEAHRVSPSLPKPTG